MKFHGVSVYTDDFKFMKPYVYTNGEWRQVTGYIYLGGAWTMVGAAATQMIPFIEDGNNQEFDASNGIFLVREEYDTSLQQNALVDSNEVMLIDINDRQLVAKEDE